MYFKLLLFIVLVLDPKPLIYVVDPYLKRLYDIRDNSLYEIIVCLKVVKKWPLADNYKQFLLFYSNVINQRIMDLFPWGHKCYI